MTVPAAAPFPPPHPDQDRSIVVARGLTKMFGSHRALDSLTLTVERGVTGLVGANGAGKTTFMSILLGLQFATAGQVTVLGMDPVRDGHNIRSVVGWAPERNVFPDHMKAFDYVRHLAEVKGLPPDEARARASDSLFLVGLGEERFRMLGTMSTGQRQRVKLAQAIAAAPKFIMLDEPTDGLDPMQREAMLDLIATVNREFAIDFLLSSHLLEEVEKVCDNVVAINAGQLVASGPVTTLLSGEAGLRIELATEPSDETLAALTAQIAGPAGDLHASFHGPRQALVLTVTGGDDADAMADRCRDAIADAQVSIRSFGRRRRSLDDLFVDGVPR